MEGDGFTRLVLLLRLRLAGFDVDFTSNGTLGLGKLRNGHPDILLVELKLCGLSGLQLVKEARANAGFGDRPIYVFTHAERMSRTARKELGTLSVQLLDKASVTREDLVQVFTSAFLKDKSAAPASAGQVVRAEVTSEESKEIVPAAIEALVQGVFEQWQMLLEKPQEIGSNGTELLSRVSSVASCAEAAGLADLARQAKALETLLGHLAPDPHAYSGTVLEVIGDSVQVMVQLPFAGTGQRKRPTVFKAVLIDESAPSLRATEAALIKARFEVASFEEPGLARQFLNSNRTSIVVANLALPEAHGLTPRELRCFPLHTGTHIIYGPELPGGKTPRDELPLRGSRMDKSPLHLSELVLRALNEVQRQKQVTIKPGNGSASTAGANRANLNRIQAAPGIAEDGFELFSTPRATKPEPKAEAAATDEPTHVVNQPVRLKALFASTGIPAQPILRVEEEVSTDGDKALLEAARLPEFAPDHILTDDQVEAVPLAQGQFVSPLAPEADTPPQDCAGLTPEIVAATGGAETALTPGEMMAEENSAEAVVTAEPIETLAPDGEIMNNHLQAFADQKAQARCAELEEEVAALRQAFEGLNGGFTDAGAADPAKEQLARELEQKLEEASAELAREREERQRAEEDFKQKLEAAVAATQEQESGRQAAEARSKDLEKQLNELRQAKEAQVIKAADKGDGQPWSGMSTGELENQVRQGVAALAKATAELAKERGERQRAQQLAADLNGRLQTLHQDLTRTLQTQGEHLSRITALEHQHDQARQALERCSAELEQQDSERRAAEEELRKAKELNAQLRDDLSFFDGANKKFDGARQDLHARLESSLNAAKENEARLQQEKVERQRLAQTLEQTQAQLQDQVRKGENLEQELQRTREALQDRDTRLQKELAERQRLTEAMAILPQGPEANPDRELEFSKVQSALQMEQVERKRQESELARMRQAALDAAHAARSLRHSLRRQIREPVDNLVQSTRTLLELEMGEEQKRLAESVLQDVLLVQTRLREPAPVHGGPAEAGSTQNGSET